MTKHICSSDCECVFYVGCEVIHSLKDQLIQITKQQQHVITYLELPMYTDNPKTIY